MKFMIGPYKVSAGRPEEYLVPEFAIRGPGFMLDIDWTDDKFPIGWCAGVRLGPKVWYEEGRGPYSRWHIHWSWNAPYTEPNRLGAQLGWLKIDISCFTWWKFVTERIEYGDSVNRAGHPIGIIHGHRERCFPCLEDGWPIVRISKLRWSRAKLPPDEDGR